MLGEEKLPSLKKKKSNSLHCGFKNGLSVLLETYGKSLGDR